MVINRNKPREHSNYYQLDESTLILELSLDVRKTMKTGVYSCLCALKHRCGYSLEPPYGGVSNVCTRSMF